MARFTGNVNFTGRSGIKYLFELWDLESTLAPVAANYIITKQGHNLVDGGKYPVIYCGETFNLRKEFSNHEKADCFQKEGAKLLCVRRERNRQIRKDIDRDLKRYYSPPCND
jgi:hypothetical protein